MAIVVRASNNPARLNSQLVATTAGDQVAVAYAAGQALRRLLHQQIAGRAAKAFVDLVQLIEIAQDQGHRRMVPPSAINRLVEMTHQLTAIGQSGQQVDFDRAGFQNAATLDGTDLGSIAKSLGDLDAEP